MLMYLPREFPMAPTVSSFQQCRGREGKGTHTGIVEGMFILQVEIWGPFV
jgi:hypothetical protein